MQDALNVANRYTPNDRFFQRVGVCAQNILIGDFVALTVTANRIGERYVVASLSTGT